MQVRSLFRPRPEWSAVTISPGIVPRSYGHNPSYALAHFRRDVIIPWIEENTTGDWCLRLLLNFEFENPADALLFKMNWSQ